MVVSFSQADCLIVRAFFLRNEGTTLIAKFRYIKIQPKTKDISMRLREINYRVCEVYSPEPRSDFYCFRLNFKIPKLGCCVV